MDTYGSYAFGFLHLSKQPEAAVAVLLGEVLPFYRRLKLSVKAILTEKAILTDPANPSCNGREFCGSERHPYEL